MRGKRRERRRVAGMAERARRRPGPAPAPGSVPGTLACVMLGGVAWVVFAMWAHVWLIGRAPFG